MTKRIVFIRHAKSDWSDWRLSDFDRSLNERGKSDLPVMAQKWQTFGFAPDLIISSSAVRARETASYFAHFFESTIRFEDNIYHSMPYIYLEHIHTLDQNIRTVVLVGHNPGISYLANIVAPNLNVEMPTCGMLFVTSIANNWGDVTFDDMRYETFLAPKI